MGYAGKNVTQDEDAVPAAWQISVVIPVFNCAEYISRCLESVLLLPNVAQVIVVDDCSTDGSLEKVKRCASKDARITVIEMPNNVGAAAARNAGLALVECEWVWFVDGDDAVFADAPKRFFSSPNAANADLLAGARAGYFGEGDITYRQWRWQEVMDSPDPVRTLARRLVSLERPFINGCWNYLFRTSFIRANGISFPAGMSIHEDTFFLARCLLARPTICANDEPVYLLTGRRTQAGDSVTRRYMPNLLQDDERFIALCRQLIHQLQLLDPGEEYVPLVPESIFKNLYSVGFPFTVKRRLELVREAADNYFADLRRWVKKHPADAKYRRLYMLAFIGRKCPQVVEVIYWAKKLLKRLLPHVVLLVRKQQRRIRKG